MHMESSEENEVERGKKGLFTQPVPRMIVYFSRISHHESDEVCIYV